MFNIWFRWKLKWTEPDILALMSLHQDLLLIHGNAYRAEQKFPNEVLNISFVNTFIRPQLSISCKTIDTFAGQWPNMFSTHISQAHAVF